jgi:hypothetical protein
MLNPKLERIHRIISYAYFFFVGLGLLLMTKELVGKGADGYGFALVCIFAIGPFGLFHWYAANGAAAGTRWGRMMSRGIGVLFLIGFPIGTILGFYILNQTFDSWQTSELAEDMLQN